MPEIERLTNAFNRAYSEYCKYDCEKYILEIHIIFNDGSVSHTDINHFLIDQNRIFYRGKIISPDKIAHVIYQIEELPESSEEEDMNY